MDDVKALIRAAVKEQLEGDEELEPRIVPTSGPGTGYDLPPALP